MGRKNLGNFDTADLNIFHLNEGDVTFLCVPSAVFAPTVFLNTSSLFHNIVHPGQFLSLLRMSSAVTFQILLTPSVPMVSLIQSFNVYESLYSSFKFGLHNSELNWE